MNFLGDAGMGPLCDALPRNTHLLWLALRLNGTSPYFDAQHLLPAVRANTSLRLLEADPGEAGASAERFVRDRRAGARRQ